MNARDNIKPKSIRLAILLALADGAITTIDDLQIRMDEPRKKVVDNAVHAANDDLIKRLRDDVTGGPAYQITAKGREFMASFAAEKAEVAPESPAAESDEVDEQTSRRISRAVDHAAITPSVKTGIPAADQNKEIARLQLERDEAVRKMYSARRETVAWESMASVFGCMTPHQIESRIRSLSSEFVTRSETAGYVTQRPGKPLARFAKAENAQARAMSAARAGKRAQVFALVPVGVATPGAEWVEA